MYVQQISVFIENRPGRLAQLATVLGDNQVDLIALSIADTSQFGILRIIVLNTEMTVRILQENGFTPNVADVLAIALPDSPGGLATALNLLNEAEVSVEYLYSLVRRIQGDAVIVIRTDSPEKAADVLEKNGVRLLDQSSLSK